MRSSRLRPAGDFKSKLTPWLMLALCLALSQKALAAHVRQLSPRSFAVSHSIVVVGPNSPLFNALLDRDFPGVSDLQYFQAVKPLLAIVHNNTQRVVKAFVVKWTITSASGTTSTATLPVMSVSPTGEDGLAGARAVLGHAGSGLGTELVSPFFHWPRTSSPGAHGIAQAAFVVAAQYEPLVAKASVAAGVQVTLDGAIFDDGVCFGPDTSKLFERFQAEQKAEVDEANWMLSQLSGGLTVQQLRDALSKQIYDGRNATATDATSLYTAARGRAAEGLLADLLQRGEQYVRAIAERLSQATPTALRKEAARSLTRGDGG